ncbi:hypothetical protein Afil01_41220 [Actinorhabdospora filicis]|uniref:Uncharacterized protein n=1 Tax=Actinorhabdospora filicis TaxID=1785913 RepID=A0A9W6SLU4_9ACTN|nr:hypothetical protein [Actinorhabdospora filicis]GLZ79315.1 hypothetical protein Afil01_41220 [Actinorhabdospora filicis]
MSGEGVPARGRADRLRAWIEVHWRGVLAWFAVAAMMLVAGLELLPRHTGGAESRTVQHVVVVGVAGLRWEDVSPQSTPHLWELAQKGAIASLSVRSAESPTCPLDGWYTLSAGARAAGDDEVTNGVCGPLPDERIEPDRDGDGARVAGQEAAVNRNRARVKGAELGALAESVRCSVAVGPGGAFATARPTGQVDVYTPGLPRDPQKAAELLASCALAVVDLGTLPDTPDRATVAAEVDQRLSAVLAARPADSLLMIAGVSDTQSPPRLHAAIADGPGLDGGWLTSASTGRPGYLQLVDLAPTAVEALGRSQSRAFQGEPASVEPGRPESLARAIEEMADADQQAAAQHGTVGTFLFVLTLGLFALYAAATPVLHRMRRGHGPVGVRPPSHWTMRALVGSAVALAMSVPAAILADLVPWWRAPGHVWVFLGVTLVITLALTAGALLMPRRRTPLRLMTIVSSVGVIIVAVDVLTGGALQLNGVAGYSALEGGRYSGMGSIGYGVFAAGLMMTAGCVAQNAARKWRPVVITALGSIGILIVGSPHLGADPAGAIALTAGVCLAAVISTGGWLTFARLAWATLLGVGVMLAFAAIDLTRDPGDRGPLGRFVAGIASGASSGTLRDIAEADVIAVASSWTTILVLGSAAFVGLVLLRPSGGLKRAFGLYPAARGGFVGASVAAALGGLLDGSGLYAAGAAAAITVPLAVIVALRVLARAQVRGEKSRRKVITVEGVSSRRVASITGPAKDAGGGGVTVESRGSRGRPQTI